MKSILDRSFRYTSSAQTDIRKTIARERRRLAEQQAARAADEQEAQRKVQPLARKAAK